MIMYYKHAQIIGYNSLCFTDGSYIYLPLAFLDVVPSLEASVVASWVHQPSACVALGLLPCVEKE